MNSFAFSASAQSGGCRVEPIDERPFYLSRMFRASHISLSLSHNNYLSFRARWQHCTTGSHTTGRKECAAHIMCETPARRVYPARLHAIAKRESGARCVVSLCRSTQDGGNHSHTDRFFDFFFFFLDATTELCTQSGCCYVVCCCCAYSECISS